MHQLDIQGHNGLLLCEYDQEYGFIRQVSREWKNVGSFLFTVIFYLRTGPQTNHIDNTTDFVDMDSDLFYLLIDICKFVKFSFMNLQMSFNRSGLSQNLIFAFFEVLQCYYRGLTFLSTDYH